MRANTEGRWQAAAIRAITHDVRVVRVVATGQYLATSQSDPDRVYVVTETTCQCVAGLMMDPVCAHRAALRMALGTMTRSVPSVV